MDQKSAYRPAVGYGGVTCRYKRVSGPMGFGGDIWLWGLRAAGGRFEDPKFGIVASTGTLTGNALRLELKQAGLSIENGFRSDPRVRWRVQFGGGSYSLDSRITGNTINSGDFTFLEPMLVGLFPLTRHIVLEFSAGYTFAGSTGVRLEGLFLQTEFLLGRF